MSNPNGDVEAEELLQQSKEQTRHTSEPTTSGGDQRAGDRVGAIKDALVAIDEGAAPENINLRDARLKALLVALDDTGQLEAAAARAADDLDAEPDIDTDDASQSDLARLLLRVGLEQALPDVLDDATEARKQYAIEQADTF